MIKNGNYPLRPLALFIFPLLGCILLMKSEPLPDAKAVPPYQSIVLALEFMHSNDGVLNTLDPLTPQELISLDKVNYYDFLFMAVYAGFLGLLILRTGRVIGQEAVKKAAWVALPVALADLLENVMMLNITSLYAGGASDFTPFVNFLPAFTWAKWGLLAIVFVGLGIVFIQRGTLSKVVSLLLFLPGILLVLTVVDYAGWINRFTTSIFLGFVILLIFAVCFKKPELHPQE